MTTDADLVLDCRTCVAANTTACSDCVVHHLVANDAGPIEFVPTVVRSVPAPRSAAAHAAELFVRAGLVPSDHEWVPYEEFECASSPLPA